MKLLVLDGNSILNRAFYGIKLLSTKNGDFTNGIYGFLTMLKRLLDETEPEAVAIAFDRHAPTFRHKQYAGYKANRKGMPPELAQQLPVLQELLTDLGYRIVSCEGWEADDILGTLADTCERQGDTCLIATGDRDSLQLVSGSTTVRLATTKFGQPQVTLYNEEKIQEEYGVTPQQMIDLKAIQGDSSDCIPGVAGIGPKGAGELIQKFGSVQYIYDHLDELDIKPGVKDKLEKSKENAFLSYDLGTIRKNAPIDTDLSHYVKTAGEPQKAAAAMVKLELFSLLEKFGLNAGAVQAAEQNDTAEKPEVEELTGGAFLLPRLEDEEEAYFACDWNDGQLKNLIFAMEGKLIQVTPDEAFLKAFFGNKHIRKFTHDSKLLHRKALELGCKMESVSFDTALAGYLLNPSASGYDVLRLAAEYGVSLPDFDRPELNCAAVMPKLCAALMRAIDENRQRELLETIEIPLAYVLAQMEHVGFYVDRASIETYGEEMERQVRSLRESIVEQVGYDFNINSPKQLGEALFEKMGLPHGKKTKSGWSTNADVLEELRYHPVVDDVLKYRTVAKLKSTYCDGLLKVIGPDGRIHSNFNQTETRTGRISSTEPNLQNIPVRTAIGRELRKFFAAENGVLVDADYSQIELRVLAHVANDNAMREDFLEGRDIHSSTAARVFGLPQDMVTPEMRRRAKAVNFGIVYGIGAFSLSKDIGVSVKEAGDYIKEYLRNYSGVDAYMQKVAEDAKANGYVETVFGRRRYLPELRSTNFNMRAFGERVARNMPIQGAAADVIKIAMIRVCNRLERENLKAKLILQVHDELIVECPEEEAEQVKGLLTEEMEQAVELSVPMVADAHAGKTWYDAKE
ncbi:MAG: DNA polymerase I [Acutalibacter sp.]|nr:DNA polymerase I [Acutalibacter sp.]